MSRKWLCLCVVSHFPVHISLCACVHLRETSALPLLSSAIVLRMCGHGTLYLGMCGIGESREGRWENVNELNESADPNVGCALSYIKAAFQQKRIRHSVDLSASEVTGRARSVVPEAKKTASNDFLNTKTKIPLVLNDLLTTLDSLWQTVKAKCRNSRILSY